MTVCRWSGGLRIISCLTGSVMMLTFGAAGVAAEPTVIELTRTGCQFLEPKNKLDHGFQTKSKADCERINGEMGAQRLVDATMI